MRGGKTKDEKWRGVGINLGGLRNNWEKKKISGGNLPLIYVCGKWFSKQSLLLFDEIYNNGDEPGYSGECFVLREHFIRTEHLTIVDKVNPFQ